MNIIKRISIISIILTIVLLLTMVLGISVGSSDQNLLHMVKALIYPEQDPVLSAIVLKLRFPRVLLAVIAGAVLSLGGVVFQSILRNPLAEPYILGISGGAAIGAILGIIMGLARFPGVGFTAFAGSILSLILILYLSSGQTIFQKDRLLLSGVMVNAFCSAVIMFLVSITRDARLHNIIFWLMGDFSTINALQAGLLLVMVIPCFIIIFMLSHTLNLLSMGKETAKSSGVRTRLIILVQLLTTSFMVSLVVGYCGLLGFVGLVVPHLMRIRLGPDHRVLVPACILGGGAYMVLCDILARTLPEQGEMPTGVVTALIGAPLFIYFLKRSNR
ncbi:iron ABC transporter permease [bacterium]|nr:iron ABC transporter permease [bacterium]